MRIEVIENLKSLEWFYKYLIPNTQIRHEQNSRKITKKNPRSKPDLQIKKKEIERAKTLKEEGRRKKKIKNT